MMMTEKRFLNDDEQPRRFANSDDHCQRLTGGGNC
jgi:hypothetical protein